MSKTVHLKTSGLTGSKYLDRFYMAILPSSVTCVRIVLAAVLYYRLTADSSSILFQKVVALPKWLYLFAGWDSSWYYAIAKSWYPHGSSPVWAFFPMYPALTRLIASLNVGIPVASFCVAQISGLISIILFQMTAERYFGRREGAFATVLYFTLPPVFVFSAVSYSEPVFLLFSLLAWYSHMIGKENVAGIAAAASSLTRSYGFLISLPLALDYIKQRRYRQLSYAALPLLFFLGWMLYSVWMTGDFAVIASLHTYWPNQPLVTFQTAVSQLLRGNFQAATEATGVLVGFMLAHILRVVMGLVSIVLVIFLGCKVLSVDRNLGVYVMGSVIVISFLGFFPSLGSFPRYLGFLFPIGLALKTKKRWLLILGLALFILLDYFAWWAFITDGFY